MRPSLVALLRHFVSFVNIERLPVVNVNDTMPVKVDIVPPPPANSKQPGVTRSLLYNGSKFQGHQKSKGNSYEVEVVLQVSLSYLVICETSGEY